MTYVYLENHKITDSILKSLVLFFVFTLAAKLRLFRNSRFFAEMLLIQNMSDLINLYRQAEDYFFRGISSQCLNLGDEANAYMTGGSEFNFIYITKNTNILDKILIQGKQFFDQDNLTFDMIILQELCSPQMVAILNTMGVFQKSKFVLMVLDLDKFVMRQIASFGDEIMIKETDKHK